MGIEETMKQLQTDDAMRAAMHIISRARNALEAIKIAARDGDEEEADRLIAEALDGTVPAGEAAMIAALKAIKVKLHFADTPGESMWNAKARDEDQDHWIPDWRYEIALLEHALHGTPITQPEKPTDTKSRAVLAVKQEGLDDEPLSPHAQRIIRCWQNGEVIERRHIASTRWFKADPMKDGFDWQTYEYRVQT